MKWKQNRAKSEKFFSSVVNVGGCSWGLEKIPHTPTTI